MKTAVPFTRAGGSAFRLASRSSSPMRIFASSRARHAAPNFHVDMTANTLPAATIGNHPPWRIFARFAAKNPRSTTRKRPTSVAARQIGHAQQRRATA
jgi:hypothetical protein